MTALTRVQAIAWIADQLFKSPDHNPTMGGLALSAIGVTPDEYAEACSVRISADAGTEGA